MVRSCSGDPRRTEPAHVQDIREKAADGIRTHDLLHGNYTGHQQMAAFTHTPFAGLS
jgi:hypothetical protein